MTKDFFEHQTRTLNAIYEISRVLGSSLDISTVARRCLRALSDNLDLERATLCMPDASRVNLRVVASHGLSSEEIKRGVFAVGKGVVGKVYSTGISAMLTDTSEEPEFDLAIGARPTDSTTPCIFIAVPVTLDRRCAGVLCADRMPGSATMVDEDLKVMRIIASLLAQTIQISELIQSEKEELERRNRELQEALADRYQPDNLVVESGSMQKTLSMVQRVASTEAAVLLRGESGTGKTMLARIMHFNSPRKAGAFVEVNCAALPASLIESELFGHEKGAFTGAVNLRIGRFEAARGGTIFLDEIGELPPETQAKILRVFQDGSFERLGSSETLHTNARIICATNCDLEAMVREKRFREDLYYRLMVVPIHVPALRSRRGDISPLAMSFLRHFMERHSKRVAISQEAFEFLRQYDWPGNVRELENTLERAVVLATDGQTLSSDDIPVLSRLFPQAQDQPISSVPQVMPPNSMGTLPMPPMNANNYHRVVLGREAIEKALASTHGQQTLAAQSLGVTLRQLRYRMQQLMIDAKGYRQ